MADKNYEAVRQAVNDALKEASLTKRPISYITTLKSKTSDVDGYLKWFSAQKTSFPPELSPADVLSKLKSTKFSDLASLMRLSDDLLNYRPIPLVQDKQSQFFVVHQPSALVVIPQGKGTPARPSDNNNNKNRITTHPSILTLTQPSRSPFSAATEPPRYVYILGAVLRRDIPPLTGTASASDPAFEPTNYAAVIDVLSPTHAVWLVYNRVSRPVEGGQGINDPAQQQPVFSGFSTNFDTAQAVRALADWTLTPSAKPSVDDFEKLVGQTRASGAVTVDTTRVDELNRAFSGGGAQPAP